MAAAPLAVNLGIDFGTSFTKVCFRDLGIEETGIVTFDARAVDGAMVPSIVAIDQSGRLTLAVAGTQDSKWTIVRYLKMRLADVPIPDRLPTLCGVDLNEDRAIRALSSWYLATVVSCTKIWLSQHQAERLKGRKLQWSANVGVPVEHYDSPMIEVFREVLAVAWAWAAGNDIPSHLDIAISRYEETVRSVDRELTDYHAIPETAAAVQSFLTSREATPGIYVYFDIGGGTVDGVAFNYVNWDGERKINFYSGKVAPLGVAAVASRIDAARVEDIQQMLKNNELTFALRGNLEPSSKKVQLLVANVIVTAQRKDGRNWQRDQIQDMARPRKTLARLDVSRMVPLLVFVGGGGAGSEWYQKAILSTYNDFGHVNAGIPPYELTEVPKPRDLAMNGIGAADFRRFAIAYGLSVPFGEGPDINLPSQFTEPESQEPWQPKGVVDYFDSKDAYD